MVISEVYAVFSFVRTSCAHALNCISYLHNMSLNSSIFPPCCFGILVLPRNWCPIWKNKVSYGYSYYLKKKNGCNVPCSFFSLNRNLYNIFFFYKKSLIVILPVCIVSYLDSGWLDVLAMTRNSIWLPTNLCFLSHLFYQRGYLWGNNEILSLRSKVGLFKTEVIWTARKLMLTSLNFIDWECGDSPKVLRDTT